MAKPQQSKKPLLFLIITLVGLSIYAYFYFHKSPEELAVQAAETFYEYEQSGDFAESWDMLHSLIQKKFPQAKYMEKKTSLRETLEIKSFTFNITNVERLDKWRMNNKAAYVYDVYQIQVAKEVNGVFGAKTVTKTIYVTSENSKWHLLWPFNP